MKKILIIQTAFIGDVILASPVIEKLHDFYPEAKIDFLLRKGNESLLKDHPYLGKIHIWDKKTGKYKNLIKIIRAVRKEKYDLLVNLHRFGSSGYITLFSGAGKRAGFSKNPIFFAFNHRIKHEIGGGTHEIERNQKLIQTFTNDIVFKPKLYPSKNDFEIVKQYKSQKFITISPASVWFTKQFPKIKWIELLNQISSDFKIFLLGSPADEKLCLELIKESSNNKIENLAGKLSLLQSAALMKDAEMNYTNDSAPLHLASAMNAKITAVFCSTVPVFGFGPVSDFSRIAEVTEVLKCRPCGLHGKKACPEKHFKCAMEIDIKQMLPK